MKSTFRLAIATFLFLAAGLHEAAFAGNLKIESWRNDDADIWRNQIIPAFNKHYPDIKVEYTATPPKDYNASLNARLQGGTAGDLLACRPFDASLDMYKKGQLVAVDDIKGMNRFSNIAKAAWQTDDGKTTFCVPMASVINGFMYNKEIFEKLKLTEPKTEAEFFAVLDAIKKDGTYTPLALGTADQWEASQIAFHNIGPNYWHGEEGRKKLVTGEAKFTDEPYIGAFKQLAKWAPYMGSGFQAQSYSDSQNLFSLGKAAIYPAGSWDIATFRSQASFKLGAFKPPLPTGATQCYFTDHTDIGFGINAASKNKEDAKKFLDWLASDEFATIFANALPGFFPLSDAKVEIKDDVAQTFMSWRNECKTTIRNSHQILSRGTPNLENELWNVSAQVINGTMTPEAAGQRLEDGLAKWYEPHKKRS